MSIYQIADIKVKINFVFEETKKVFKDYQIDDKSEYDIIIEADREQLEKEMETVPGLPRSIYERIIILRNFSDIILKKYNGMFFHCSAIAVDDGAYLFTAPSGTGKSTHTYLWRKLIKDKAIMVNDDKPMIRCIGDEIYVYGTPWNGKHKISNNIRVPVKGICLIHQSKTNYIEEVDLMKVLPRLLEQTVIPKTEADFEKLLEVFEKIFKKVKIGSMGCNISIEAAKMSYEFFTNQKVGD